jgi:hypothetical protein
VIWSVPKNWVGETVVILAGGPSLKGFDASILRPRHHPFEYTPVPYARVITINDSWRMAPWADVHYFCDARWRDQQVNLNRQSLDKSTDFAQMIYKGFWVKGGQDLEHPHVRTLKFTGQQGWEPAPTALRHGSNSGYQAIHLAAHYGAKRIILLGYDMHVDPKRSHWHDEERASNFAKLIELSFLPHFQTLVDPLAAAGVEVINATPGSALKCWPYLPLEEALTL